MSKATRTKLTDAIASSIFVVGFILTMGSTSEIESFNITRSLLLATVGLASMYASTTFRFRKGIYQTIKNWR